MKIGPLEFGWFPLDEADRIELGLDPAPRGWESFCIEWNGRGVMICARTRPGRRTNHG